MTPGYITKPYLHISNHPGILHPRFLETFLTSSNQRRVHALQFFFFCYGSLTNVELIPSIAHKFDWEPSCEISDAKWGHVSPEPSKTCNQQDRMVEFFFFNFCSSCFCQSCWNQRTKYCITPKRASMVIGWKISKICFSQTFLPSAFRYWDHIHTCYRWGSLPLTRESLEPPCSDSRYCKQCNSSQHYDAICEFASWGSLSWYH